MDGETERMKAAQRIHERARYLRGRFLNSVAVIERDIAVLLTDYFCTDDPEKRELFFKYVVTAPSFSLSANKQVLIRIVKKDYPRYWDEHREILKHLDDIMTFRNKLAHSIVDVSEAALARPVEKGVGFVDWKEGEPITDKQFEDWEVKTNMVSTCLLEIKRLLPFRERPDTLEGTS
jgi:hypothetical protein